MMTAMETKQDKTSATELAGIKVNYGKLKPLNPDDLKAEAKAPKVDVESISEPFSIRLVYEDLKENLKKAIMGTTVGKILLAMRVSNLCIAGLMIIVALCTMIMEKSFWSVIQDVFSVFYTMMFAVILIGYELRSEKLDQTIRDRFGFMYSPWGRCLFLCLYVQYAIGLSFHVLNRISVFPIGMMGMYGVLVSMLGFANAYFNYFVITKHPSFTRGVPDYIPPVVESDKNESATAL